MITHVVKPGESIYSIARMYNASPQKIIRDNELTDPNNLVVGQTLVILSPSQVHVLKPMETLQGIANMYNTTTVELLQNNPFISNSNIIYPGEEIVISYDEPKKGPITVTGYAYPNIDKKVLLKTLPYLTYLNLFTYGITPEGELIDINDRELIQMARNYGVAPIMLISTLTEEGKFSNELASEILNNEDIQNNLIENILENLKAKNYYGLDVDFEYILPEDREEYVEFIKKLTTRLNEEGFPVITALAPKISSDQKGLLYEAHDYPSLGEIANKVLLMTYEWGYTYGPAMAVSPVDKVREVLDYAVTEIEPQKIIMGMPNYGYDFTIPYVQGESKADLLSNVEAVQLAEEVGAQIQYDETSKAPYFTYYDSDGKQHKVWFEDARSVEDKLKLYDEYNFDGVAFWNIMSYFPQSWLVINSLYDIEKVI
nr:glycosyl hydrolase family 18 protein [Sedimentibacter sp.]